ncbi:MAG: hypothetical protein REI11_04595 [Patulibacter sp.]|nr:hypothetical protein [Patulibacter sp.]
MSTTTVPSVRLSEKAAEALSEYADLEIYLIADSGGRQDPTTIREKGHRLVCLADLLEAADTCVVEVSHRVQVEMQHASSRAAENESEAQELLASIQRKRLSGLLSEAEEEWLAGQGWDAATIAAYRDERIGELREDVLDLEGRAASLRLLVQELSA